MALFDVVRVWDVWPGGQVLRDLFRQAPTHSSGEKVCRVFSTQRHLFVATKTETNADHLYGFSTVKDMEGEADSLLPLSTSGGQAVAVFSFDGEVCIIREWGQLEVLCTEGLGWRHTAFTQLSTGHVHCCAVHEASHHFVYCVSPGLAGSSFHQVFSCHYHLKGGDSLQRSVCLEDAALLLSDCPEVELWPWRGGVAVHPNEVPPGLLLLWLPTKTSQLQPFILNDHSCAPHSLSALYPSLCLQLAPIWSKAHQENGVHIVSLTVGMVTADLLILLSSGDVLTLETHGDRVQTYTLATLKDFSEHYTQARSQKAELKLFSLHSYCGVFSKGELRLYDVFCGDMVWECGEHEGHHISLLAPPFSWHWIGVYDNSGVWMLRSQKLSEHTQLLSQALFPITTNADETTPGDFLEEGQVLAATLSWLWGLPLPATRSALDALQGVVQIDREEGDADSGIFLPHLSVELQSILGRVSLQSPALLVALLAEHPRYRYLVSQSIERFMQTLRDDAATSMTNEIGPLLGKYLSLCHCYEQKLSHSTTEHLLPTPSALTTSLLHRLECGVDSSRVGLRAQLQLLSVLSPLSCLSGLRDFFAVPNFTSALEAIEAGNWQSNRNWKAVFGMEVGSEVGWKALDPTAPNVPVFELTCRLLYRENPANLVPFVKFAQLARDYQAQGDSSFARKCRKTYFFQRAVQCLPVFVSKETASTCREALLAHSALLLHSEFSGCEGSALGLLLRGHLWEDAVAFLENQAINSSYKYSSLFQSLLATMAQEGVVHCYIDRVWQLVPENFSVFDMLSLLVHSPVQSSTPTLPGHTCLVVSDIGSRLLDLLPETKI